MTQQARVFDQLLQIAAILQKDMAQSFEGTGLTGARTHLLWELAALGPSPQNALAAALDVSARNVTGLVDALEAGGYVSRAPHPTDRRISVVSLTGLGEATMARMQREHQMLSEGLVDGLKEVERIEGDLDELIRRLQIVLTPETFENGGTAASRPEAAS
ncbi:MarR family winged helix-turn-helix transcriptional regulator [Leifsonia sp. NPDC058230]|uniref:MarR family winged helix-turn-helix transcriptional regulator n=1 Tax=Leifsonia sp. NPDC058230 TaxID=3346391 RepID=UPI0036D9D1C2